MTRDEIRDRVIKFFTETLDCPTENLTEDSHLVDDLEIDSLSVLELTVFTEDEFDVDIEFAFKDALHRESEEEPTLGWLVDVLHGAINQRVTQDFAVG